MKIDLSKLNGDLSEVVSNKFSEDVEFKGVESDVWIVNMYGEKVHIAARGGMTCFWGLPKSGKSITLELITAAILSPEKKVGNFYSRKGFDNVLYIDMEQSPQEWMAAMYRVLGYAGLKKIPENLLSLTFRTIHRPSRIEYLEILVDAIEGVDAIILDGIADLCLNESDSTSANNVFDSLSLISARKNCAIITIVHSNRDRQSRGPRDHLGVKAEKYCSTLPEIVKDEDSNSFLISPYMDRNGGAWRPLRLIIGKNKMVEFDGIELNPMVPGSFRIKNKNPNDELVDNLLGIRDIDNIPF